MEPKIKSMEKCRINLLIDKCIPWYRLANTINNYIIVYINSRMNEQ